MNLSNKRRSWFFFFSPPDAKRFATVRPNEYDPGDVRLQLVQVQTDQNNKNSSSLMLTWNEQNTVKVLAVEKWDAL